MGSVAAWQGAFASQLFCLGVFLAVGLSSGGTKRNWFAGSIWCGRAGTGMIIGSIGLQSIWLASCGLSVIFLGLMHATSDRLCETRRLTSYGLASFLAAGLPPFLSTVWRDAVWSWTADCTSAVATFSGFLHVHDGHLLRTSAGVLNVAQDVYGWAAWDVFAVLATLAGLYWRRSGLQLFFLWSAAVVIGILSAIPAYLLQLAWISASGGGSGWMLCSGLFWGVPLLLSCDSLVLFLTSPVGLTGFVNGQEGEEEVLENPLSIGWNRWIAGDIGSFSSRLEFYLADGNMVPLGRCLRFAGAGWLGSRSPIRMIVGLPGLVALMFAVSGKVIATVTIDSQARVYERVAVDALAAGDFGVARVCREAVRQLQPRNLAAQFRIAELLWNAGKTVESWELMRGLAADGKDGYGPAHLWLLTHEMGGDDRFEFNSSERIKHCRKLLRTLPEVSDAAADVLAELGREYASAGEMSIAQECFTGAVAIDGNYLCELCAFEQLRGKSLSGDQRLLEFREGMFAAVKRDPHDRKSIILCAQSSMLLGERSVATATLRKGWEAGRDATVGILLGDNLLAEAERCLIAGNADAGLILSYLKEIESVDPGRPEVLLMLCDLELAGVETSLTDWFAWDDLLQRCSILEEQTVVVTEACLLAGILLGRDSLSEPAARRLAAVSPGAAVRGVALLHRRKQSARAGTIADLLLMNCAPKNHGARFAVLRADRRYADARAEYSQLIQLENSAVKLRGAYYTTMVEEYDILAEWRLRISGVVTALLPIFVASVEDHLLELLETASTAAETRLLAVDRLSRLLLSDRQLASRADDMLLRIRATGEDLAACLEVMGHAAVSTQSYEQAAAWLEQAAALHNAAGDALLNNLAISLIRVDPERNGSRALQLINDVLKRTPGRAEFLSTRGEILLQSGQSENAIVDLEAAAAQLPPTSETHRLLNFCRERLGIGTKDEGDSAVLRGSEVEK